MSKYERTLTDVLYGTPMPVSWSGLSWGVGVQIATLVKSLCVGRPARSCAGLGGASLTDEMWRPVSHSVTCTVVALPLKALPYVAMYWDRRDCRWMPRLHTLTGRGTDGRRTTAMSCWWIQEKTERDKNTRRREKWPRKAVWQKQGRESSRSCGSSVCFHLVARPLGFSRLTDCGQRESHEMLIDAGVARVRRVSACCCCWVCCDDDCFAAAGF